MIDVSVIMPVYNIEPYLRKAVESVQGQTMDNYEIILVDDGSTDCCPEICDELAAEDDRITVIHQENMGSGYARNSGLDAAKGKYIYFMDPDDYIDSGLLEDNLSLLEETGADFVLFGHYDETWSSDGKRCLNSIELKPILKGVLEYREWKQLFYEYLAMTPWTLWTHIYRHSYLKESGVRFKNQRVGQDVIFHIELFQRPFTRGVFNQRCYYHYVMKEGSAVTKYHPDRFACELNIAKKTEALFELLEVKGEKYSDWIAFRYANAVLIEVNSISMPECPMSHKKKVAHLKEICAIPKIKEAIEKVSFALPEGKSRKFKLWLLKRKHYPILILLKRFQIQKRRKSA